MSILAQQSQSDTATAALFYVFAAMSVGSALWVVISRNIVRTAVALLFTLIGVAGLYFMLNAEFLAAVQLVVYAGGTLILIIFGVMLTSKSPVSRFEPKLVEVVIAMTVGAVLLIALVAAILRAQFVEKPIETTLYPMDKLGQALLGDYLIPFEIASVLLLVVMIGAAYLAKARRRDEDQAAAGAASQRARQWS
jgi:NADH-quinone oxidoreductase subunit J